MEEYIKNTPEQNQKKKKDLILYWSLFLTFNIINYIFGPLIFDFSKQLSFFTQKFNIDTFSYFFSKVFFHSLFGYIIIAPFIRKHKIRLFLNIIQVFFAVYFSNILKMLYRASRPSFEENNLRGTSHFCENDYGMPSAHTLIIIILMLIISKDITRHSSIKTKKIVKLISFILMVVVVFTRIYFGVHSVNQVFMGIFAGSAIYSTFGYFEDYLCINLILPFLLRNQFEEKRKTVMKIFSFVFLFLNLVLVFIFMFCKQWELKNSEFFKFNNCESTLTKFPNFSYRLYVFCSLFNHTYGLFLGIYLFKNDFLYACRLNYEKNWKNNTKRILIFLLVSLGMLFWKKPNFSKNGNSYLSLIQSVIVPMAVGFLQSFAVFKIYDYLNIPYQRIKKEGKKD